MYRSHNLFLHKFVYDFKIMTWSQIFEDFVALLINYLHRELGLKECCNKFYDIWKKVNEKLLHKLFYHLADLM